MSVFDISVKKLYGVGNVRAEKYENMGIQSVGELLMHYPRGYEDRGSIKLLTESDFTQKSAYLLTVATEPKSVRIKGRMTLTKLRAYDDSASCEITFFNQDYLKNVFGLGQTFRFYGKVDCKKGKYTMTSPVYEPWRDDEELPELVSVYKLTSGLSQKQLSKDIKNALTLFALDEDDGDTLPEEIRKKRALCLRSYAIRNIHAPDSFSSLAAAKKRLIYDEFFSFALGMTISSAKKQRQEAFPCRVSDLSALEKNIPFTLTAAQRRVISEIKEDMSSSLAMSRIVIGDVGSGKTLCAAAAMLFAVQSGHQAALMAPTEILARQHYLSLCDIFNPLGIKCELLLGATSAAQKKKIYERLNSSGEDRIDVLVGTQALLSSGVEFSSLGLAVIDEQHRFGVGQRSLLSKKNTKCHILLMSATPIPRSLALALYGELDISALDELPTGRQKVDTFVVDESYRERLNGFIRKQIAEGGQVYVVCPAVEESEENIEDEEANLLLSKISLSGSLLDIYEEQKKAPKLKSALKFSEELAKEFPEFRVDFMHGKLKSSQKEEKMQSFVEGKTNILVSTTVIEVGVNVPAATLMIVENAERFGLSQLHQLRGRVGRGSKKSYCILVSELAGREGSAKERLLTLKGSNDGFAIAQKDLEMRGPGDFIRTSPEARLRQSGGVRFRLAELCDDTGLMSAAFEDARELIKASPELLEYPLLKREVQRMFTSDVNMLN